MPPMVLAAGIMGGTSLASGLMNRGNKKQEQQMMGLQQQTAQRQSQLANTITGFAQRQHSMADPAINKAMQYYMQVAGGDRAAMQQALSPQINQLNATYGGAERGMMARMAPGAQRDSALADLYKQRAGQIGQAGIQGRQDAVGGLANMGQNLQGQANGLWGAAAGALGGSAMTQNQMAGQAMQRNQQNSSMWQGIGQNMGNILLPYLLGGSGGQQKPQQPPIFW